MSVSVAVFQYCSGAKKVHEMRIKLSFFLTILMSLFICFSSLKAQSNSLALSHKKPQKSSKVDLGDSSKNRVKDDSSAQLKSKTSSAFFERHAEGWHWYQALSESLSDNKVEEVKPKRDAESPPQTPTEAIEAQRKALEAKLHAAIIDPTREKIIAYIIAQKALMDQSQRFSDSWKRVVMTIPSLDETLIHPVDQNARHVYYQERNQEITKRIKALAQEYGLFFFFKGECPYCHHFAPIVKHFAKKHGWSVLGISMDGGPLRSTLPEFPDAKRDNGIAARLQVLHVPALIAFHSRSGQMIPLAYGMVSESEIEERVELLTRTFRSEGVKK